MERNWSSKALLVVLVFGGAFFLSQCASERASDEDPLWPTRVPETIVFERDVRPLLEVQCVQCHNSKDAGKWGTDFNLETRELAMTTGRQPPAIFPGDPDKSPLIKVLQLDSNHPTNMPPAPDKIWGVRLEILKEWVRQGAEWPESQRMVRIQDWES